MTQRRETCKVLIVPRYLMVAWFCDLITGRFNQYKLQNEVCVTVVFKMFKMLYKKGPGVIKQFFEILMLPGNSLCILNIHHLEFVFFVYFSPWWLWMECWDLIYLYFVFWTSLKCPKMFLKINWSIKTLWHRPSMGVAFSGLWVPVDTWNIGV